jgi:DNA-binding CsgD family transcriptional regulator
MATLTARERETALLLAKGKTPVQIADDLSINRRTVYKYLERIKQKTFTDSTIELAVKMAVFCARE